MNTFNEGGGLKFLEKIKVSTPICPFCKEGFKYIWVHKGRWFCMKCESYFVGGEKFTHERYGKRREEVLL